jgi:hypothetical protein
MHKSVAYGAGVTWALVFFCTFLADIAWVRYVASAGVKARWYAATWAGVLVPVVEYTHNRWLLVPAVLGAFLGTAVGVK